jgi:hypothetical protein
MKTFRIPKGVYVPLCNATDHAGQVMSIPAREGHVFNTKVRVVGTIFPDRNPLISAL